jgi:iron complex transport system permease protein
MTLANGRGLDLILFGEDFAALSGANVGRIRLRAMASTCLMTGVVTAFCGPIGFVGIIAPHIARRICRSSAHRRILPTVLLTGSGIALAADILSRIWPIPIPVGSTMALVGIPVILLILLRK